MHKELILNNSISELTLLEGFVSEVCDELQEDAALTFNINLVLEEIATNVINYAFPQSEKHSFSIIADGDAGGMLTFQIIDDGVAFDPTNEAPDVDVSLGVEERPIGGLGIFLVKQIMDDVIYNREDNKNILTLRKKL